MHTYELHIHHQSLYHHELGAHVGTIGTNK